ncbi:MogA/MoaB family molybdenum cofactor biosynthesis protein [Salininema proteolyticum]|uniref:Molybdenum cofactor biosynthesis protein B n=1 Tax=Salininema proteolyticum TaxID=1607685 RepID=A0ABV8U5I4_9ACTN
MAEELKDSDGTPGRGPCGRLDSPIKARVIVASTRAATGVYADKSGPVLVDGLRSGGLDVDGPVVVPDGPEVEKSLREAVADGRDFVITSGGTGLTPTDRTPEATRAVIDFEVPGLAEALRAYGRAKLPQADLSRGLAGAAGATLIVNIAGSSGAAKDALAVLTPDLLSHCVSQLRGGDHPQPSAPEGASS